MVYLLTSTSVMNNTLPKRHRKGIVNGGGLYQVIEGEKGSYIRETRVPGID